MRKSIVLSLLLLVGSFSFAGTCGNSYTYSRTITIDHAKVPNTDQTNFPLLFTGTYSYLATAANGGQVQNTANNSISRSGPADLVFCDAASGGNALKYEVESYSATTGAITAWIQIPTLSHTTDTVIYLFANNSGVSTSQQDLTMWGDVSYVAVYHMPNGATLDVKDSSASANNGTINGSVTATTGLFDGGANFAGTTSDYVRVTSSSSFKPTTALTLEAWGNPTDCTTVQFPNFIGIDYRANGSWSPPFYAYNLASGQSGNCIPDGNLTIGGSRTNIGCPSQANAANYPEFVAMTYNSTSLKLYMNGSQCQTTSLSGNIDYGTSSDLALGTRSPYTGSSSEVWKGMMDEVRISTAAKSADWIATEWNNNHSPQTFYNITPFYPGCSGYTFHRSITIDHTKAGSADTTDYPFLWTGTFSYLATVANGGDVQSSSGYDVCFASDSAGTNQLDHEVETWVNTGTSVAYWIRVPTLSHTSDTTIYVFYGNASISTTRENIKNVWKNYAAVYHFGLNGSLSLLDSGYNVNTLTNNNTVTTATGIVGKAGSFTAASSQYLNSAITMTTPAWQSERTVEFWYNMPSPSGTNRVLFAFGNQLTNNQRIESYYKTSDGKVYYDPFGTSTPLFTDSPDSNWHYYALSTNTSAVPAFYLDNSASVPSTLSPLYTMPGKILIGSDTAIGSYMNGSLDEFRISYVQRSSSYVAATYNNLTSPGTFFSVGSPSGATVRRRASIVY
jgi:hypothetical protein